MATKDATGTFRTRKVTETTPNAERHEFQRLCILIDATNFRRPPYKGLLGKVAVDLGFKGGRRSLYKAIHESRNLNAMLAVAQAIHAVNETVGQTVRLMERSEERS